MSLQESNITKNISKDAILWRYMTLDKLINILSTQQLYFTSLHSYEKTDPFEGVLPKVALDAMKEIHSLGEPSSLLAPAMELREHLLKQQPNEQARIELLEKAIAGVKDIEVELERVFFRVFKSTVVNCWHQNEVESEAMWRLYSENHKGIAIQTTFQDLVDSIDDQRIFISEVKYINFHDKNLKPTDCIVNGYITPLLKRQSFEHEKEVRLFFQPENNLEKLRAEQYEYQSQLIDVDTSKLISKVYISPFASELFVSSVREVLKRFNISESKIIHSDLLKIDDSLFKLY